MESVAALMNMYLVKGKNRGIWVREEAVEISRAMQYNPEHSWKRWCPYHVDVEAKRSGLILDVSESTDCL